MHSPGVVATSLLALLAMPWPAHAAQPLSTGGVDIANFAYATRLGSGIYSLDGRTLQVYRLPFSWRALEAAGGSPGLRLHAPVTFGLLDFKPVDVVETGLPDRLDTLSAALGIELELPLGAHWSLLPYVEAGRAWDLGGEADATLASLELHAEGNWDDGSRSSRVLTGISSGRVALSGGASGDFVMLEAGAERRWPLAARLGGRTLELGGYALLQWFADSPDEPLARSADARSGEPLQVELGVMLGSRPMPALWGLPLPRLGLGWRFGREVSVIRFVIGAPF